ncbi:hypothetical protein HDU85_006542 [Gaertneriomyces sp. JEL0708]|nr:hypothetical protein HDU85_006542 [Gaertneriomyces sp. JEL0708]
MSAHFQQLANIGAGAALATVITAMTLYENIVRIKDIHMKYSIIACMCSFIIAMSFVSYSWRAMPDNPPLFVDRIIGATFFYDLTFTLLTYHSAYRTILICRPITRRIPLYALLIAFTQMIIHGCASYFWAINMKDNYGTLVSPVSSKMEVVVLVYYSVVESVLFVLTQYRIVEVKIATMANKAETLGLRTMAGLYGQGLMRSFAYTISITMGFIALGNALPLVHLTVTEAWNFPMYGPVFCMIVILTDVNRFQSAIATLTKATSDGKRSENSESNAQKMGKRYTIGSASSNGQLGVTQSTTMGATPLQQSRHLAGVMETAQNGNSVQIA